MAENSVESVMKDLGVKEAGMIQQSLEGKEVVGFKSGKVSAVSYLQSYVRAVEFVDLITRKVAAKRLTIDGVLFFRAKEGNNRMMMRVTALIGGQKFVCFKSGQHMMDLVGMFVYKLEHDQIDWRVERVQDVPDDTKDFEGGLDKLNVS